MSTGYQAKFPRGPHRNNVGDAAAFPLLSARVLREAKDDALKARPLSPVSDYYRRSVDWFHASITGTPLRFVNLDGDVPNTLTGRATTFRKSAGDDLNTFIRLSVAGPHSAAKVFAAGIRSAAEAYLIDELFKSVSVVDRLQSEEYARAFFYRLQREGCFAGLMSDSSFANFRSQFKNRRHEVRLIEFANITLGLCS